MLVTVGLPKAAKCMTVCEVSKLINLHICGLVVVYENTY